MIFVNFKTFEQGIGDKALGLVKTLEEVSIQTGIKIIPVVNSLDLQAVVEKTNLEVWIQHIDPVTFGAHTGSILPEEVAQKGAKGTFLNHSEHKVKTFEELEQSVKRAREVGLKILVFASTLDELKLVSTLSPDYLSYEPPQLIGSTTVSVAQAQPEVIGQAAEVTGGVPLIVGAGVHSADDVRTSIKLGAMGIAVATDIVKAEDPKKELMDLIEGFKE